MYMYSAKNNAFFLSDSKDLYKAEGTWPDDVVSVSVEVFSEFSGVPPEGKIRVAGKNGLPEWQDIPPLTPEQIIMLAEAEKKRRINQAIDYMNSKQWPGKAVLGRLKGDDLAQYNLWLDYLDELEAVKTSDAPDIKWPIPPASAEG